MDNNVYQQFAKEMRQNYRALIPSAGIPDRVADVSTIMVPASGSDPQIPVRVYNPANDEAGPLPVLIYIHGGGFVSGDLDTHDVLCRALAVRTNAMVFSVDWRLAPEHPFPAGMNDVYAVLEWIASNAKTLGADPQRIAVSGDSAGGTIAAAITMLVRDRKGPALSGQLLLYPRVSNSMDRDSKREFGEINFPTNTINQLAIESYTLGGTNINDPLVVPLMGEHHDLPPALVLVGGVDPFRDESVAYAEALQKAGTKAESKVYSEQEHGFIQFFKDKPTHPLGEAALGDAVAFLKQVFA